MNKGRKSSKKGERKADEIITKDRMVGDAKEAKAKLASGNKTHSLREMLCQGLVSNDVTLLENAFSISEPVLIRDSLREVPQEKLIALIDALVTRIIGRPRRTSHLVPWLETLLTLRADDLFNEPSVAKHLKPLLPVIDERCRTYRRTLQAQAKVEFMLKKAQWARQGECQVEGVVLKELMEKPMATFDEDVDEDANVEEWVPASNRRETLDEQSSLASDAETDSDADSDDDDDDDDDDDPNVKRFYGPETDSDENDESETESDSRLYKKSSNQSDSDNGMDVDEDE